jgi:hypothetical protein
VIKKVISNEIISKTDGTKPSIVTRFVSDVMFGREAQLPSQPGAIECINVAKLGNKTNCPMIEIKTVLIIIATPPMSANLKIRGS